MGNFDAWLFADTDNTLFYDTVTCRYFTASLFDIKAAMEELTFLNTKCGITIRTYLEELGFLNFGSGYIYDWIGWPPYEGSDKKFAELLYTVINYGTETPQKCYMIIPTSSTTDLRANK